MSYQKEFDKWYGLPTDYFRIDRNFIQKMDEIIPISGLCPADIYRHNNIPLKDIGLNFECGEPPYEAQITIVDYNKIIHNTIYGDAIGMLKINKSVFGIFDQGDYLCINISETNEYQDAEIALNEVLILWYQIQVLLLHPRIEVLERKAVLQKLKGKDKITATSTGRKVKYIKRYYITPEDIDLMINGDRHYKRKCLSWYVIGHYREYKNGKRIFIQGYWKGELRALKRNFDERERVV